MRESTTQGYMYRGLGYMGVPIIRGYLFGGPYSKD